MGALSDLGARAKPGIGADAGAACNAGALDVAEPEDLDAIVHCHARPEDDMRFDDHVLADHRIRREIDRLGCDQRGTAQQVLLTVAVLERLFDSRQLNPVVDPRDFALGADRQAAQLTGLDCQFHQVREVELALPVGVADLRQQFPKPIGVDRNYTGITECYRSLLRRRIKLFANGENLARRSGLETAVPGGIARLEAEYRQRHLRGNPFNQALQRGSRDQRTIAVEDKDRTAESLPARAGPSIRHARCHACRSGRRRPHPGSRCGPRGQPPPCRARSRQPRSLDRGPAQHAERD